MRSMKVVVGRSRGPSTARTTCGRLEMLATRLSLLELQRLDLDHDVLAARRVFRRTEHHDVMVDIFFDLFGQQKLRDIEVRIALSSVVVERVIIRSARGKRTTGGNEATGKLPRQGAAATVTQVYHGRGLSRGRGPVCAGR